MIPPGTCSGAPCWSANSKGFSYSDPDAAPTGIKRITLKSGIAGKAKIIVKGGGDALDTPPLPLAQDPQVVVQLKNTFHGGRCWESRFSGPPTKNDASQFKDRGDAPVATATPSGTATVTATATSTPVGPTATSTVTPTVTSTRTATNTPIGGVPTSTETPTFSPTPTFTATSTPGGATAATASSNRARPAPAAPRIVSSVPAPAPARRRRRSASIWCSRRDSSRPRRRCSSPTTAAKLSIPGTGTATSVRQRVVAPPPVPQAFTPNDLEYAVQVQETRLTPLAHLFTATFDRCTGAALPTLADLACTVTSCAQSGAPVSGCTCTVSLP